VRALVAALLAALLVVVAAAPSRAAGERDVEARARDHYESGRTLYRLGNYREALAQFTAGYELVKRPRFLLNLAQTFRKLGDDPNARRMIERYLGEADPNDPARAQAKELLAELGPEPAPPPPTTPVPATPPPTVTATPDPAAIVAAPAPTPAPKRASGVAPLGLDPAGLRRGRGRRRGRRLLRRDRRSGPLPRRDHRLRRDAGEQVALEPRREGAHHRRRSGEREAGAAGRRVREVAAPPADERAPIGRERDLVAGSAGGARAAR